MRQDRAERARKIQWGGLGAGEKERGVENGSRGDHTDTLNSSAAPTRKFLPFGGFPLHPIDSSRNVFLGVPVVEEASTQLLLGF